MNLYLKNTALLLCIILVVMMYDCKKDNPITTQNGMVFHEFRDSLVGTYNCEEHYYNWTPILTTDTVVGPTVVTVSKFTDDDSSIIVNGNIFRFNFSSTQGSVYSFYNNSGIWNECHFTVRNDSIWFQNFAPNFRINDETMYYWTGRKQ